MIKSVANLKCPGASQGQSISSLPSGQSRIKLHRILALPDETSIHQPCHNDEFGFTFVDAGPVLALVLAVEESLFGIALRLTTVLVQALFNPGLDHHVIKVSSEQI